MSETVEARILDMLSQTLDRLQNIDKGLALQTEMLRIHTASDSANFDALNGSLNELKTKLGLIELARAREEGEKIAASKSAKFSAATWGGGIAAFVMGVVEAVRHFWGSAGQ